MPVGFFFFFFFVPPYIIAVHLHAEGSGYTHARRFASVCRRRSHSSNTSFARQSSKIYRNVLQRLVIRVERRFVRNEKYTRESITARRSFSRIDVKRRENNTRL